MFNKFQMHYWNSSHNDSNENPNKQRKRKSLEDDNHNLKFCQNIGKTTISLFLGHYLLKNKITEKVFINSEIKVMNFLNYLF